ncbi:MAG: FtsX-like permease family protein [Eubacterium sp.]|nr:FtsX-like permease family protein [Eubacterium sp.]
MDLRVVSDQGITERELKEIGALKGVSCAEGVYWTDAVLNTDQTELVVRMTSMTEEVNLPQVTEGRLPKTNNECLFDRSAMDEAGLKIGDTITIREESSEENDAAAEENGAAAEENGAAAEENGAAAEENGTAAEKDKEDTRDQNEDAESQVLKVHSFTIVGTGVLPYFTDTYRGSSSAGDGSLDAFALVPDAAFDMPVYTEADLLAEGAAEELYAGKNYDSLIGMVSDRIEKWSEANKRTDREMAKTFDFELPTDQDLKDIQEGLDLRKTKEEKLSEAENQAVDTALEKIEEQILTSMTAQGMTEDQAEAVLNMQGTSLQEIAKAQLSSEQEEEIRQTAREEAAEKIEDAIQKAEDAEADVDKLNDKLKELESPEWTILDWNAVESSLTYDQNADRIQNLSRVLPVMFFLVAALVSLTAMTRMVDEQRESMGTMKALGYTTGQIAGKYVGYAMIATIAGSIAGVLLGEKYLTLIVVKSYGTVYPGMDVCITPFNWQEALLAVAASAASTGIATIAACIRQLRSTPAELMRPEPPGGGKRVWLENVPFVWNHLNFTWKSTCRNLFRYKKRFFMTIIGIGGCMGLLIAGFGLRDSIAVIAKRQYSAVMDYDAAVSVEKDASETEQKDCTAYAESLDGYKSAACMEKTLDLSGMENGGTSYTAKLIVPEDPDGLNAEFIHLNDRQSRKSYDFPLQGAAISEKTARLLGIKVGDSVYAKVDEKRIQLPVAVIFENYMNNFILMTPDEYHMLFGEDYQENTLLVRKTGPDITQQEEKELARGFMELDAVKGISFISEEYASIENMLNILDLVLGIIVVAAGLLALVVIYNLNSINITERRRELATLKVLGFYDGEVASYVYRENVILTILGIATGILLGWLLHRFIVTTVETDYLMFGRSITAVSYLAASAATACFSLIVNAAMYRTLRKIDMIQSLKSVE